MSFFKGYRILLILFIQSRKKGNSYKFNRSFTGPGFYGQITLDQTGSLCHTAIPRPPFFVFEAKSNPTEGRRQRPGDGSQATHGEPEH